MLEGGKISQDSGLKDAFQVHIGFQSRRPWKRMEFLTQGAVWWGARRTYLQVEAVCSCVQPRLAGEAVPGTAAEDAGEEAEQQEVTEQDLHGAGPGSKVLKHTDGCMVIILAIWGMQDNLPARSRFTGCKWPGPVPRNKLQ